MDNNHIDQSVSRFHRNPDKRIQIFQEIPENKRVAAFLRFRKPTQYQILRSLPKDQVISLLRSMDPDDATDALQLFSENKQEQLLKDLSGEMQDQLRLLLKFNKETAGGLMSLDYIQVDAYEKIEEAAKKFRSHEKRTGKPPEILVQKDGKLVGYVPGYELGFATPEDIIGNHIKPIRTIHHNAPDAEVVKAFKSHPHTKLIVLDDQNHVLGIIYSDDVLKILNEQESASLYNFAGIKDEEDVTDPAMLKIKFRYQWLIINLATAFLAAFTVGLFSNTLDKYVLLAVYMPIVAGMGGNAATQTLAVMVRGIALNHINFKNFLVPLRAELIAGLVNGLINGILVFTVVMILNKEFMIALVLTLAMVINLLVAAFFGTIIPLIMKYFKKDPASSATIFITTATDVLGFLAFLGLATLLLN